jgi:deoxyribose-phosphate aldolase
MPMGKEKSYFKVETIVVKREFELDQTFPDFGAFMQLTMDSTPNHVLKCVLLSDARLNDSDLQNLENICLMQIVNQNRFRYIKSATGKFFSGAKPVKVNMAFNLLSKGSVMFIKKEDKTKIENLFNKYLDFKQIGYNYIHFSNAKTI